MGIFIYGISILFHYCKDAPSDLDTVGDRLVRYRESRMASGVLYRRLWNRGSWKEEFAEKIIAGEAAMSYRLRLLPAVSHSGHNFTGGDSRGAVYSPMDHRERKGWKQEENSLFLFLSPAGRVIYRAGNHPHF